MSDQIDPAFKAAYRETQGQPVDAVERRTYLTEWLKSFSVFAIEDDEDSIRLSMGGRQIACWSASSPQGVAMLQFDAGHREAATALAEEDARIAELLAADEQRARDISRLTVERDEARAALGQKETGDAA
jgi:hypothetical protein